MRSPVPRVPPTSNTRSVSCIDVRRFTKPQAPYAPIQNS